jgi:hypothetical protein
MPTKTEETIIRRTGDCLQQVIGEFRDAGWLVFGLPAGIADRAGFFTAIKSVMPLDPPLMGGRSWDALSDSLWGA